jgi:ElaB/YqjD/DUF883 family membrane-anchored ribosome-binding protein
METENPMASSNTTSTQKQIERIGEGAQEAIERLGEKAEEWLELKDTWVDGTREYVRAHPIAALGIAAAAGYVLSMLMRSRD